jgi:hypothetical protein
MYAITGLIFNLVIIYQITFAVFLYEGNTDDLASDIGYATGIEVPSSGVTQSMNPVSELMEKAESAYGPVKLLRFYNYGDETAVVQLSGEYPEVFSNHYDVYYRVQDGTLLFEGGTKHNYFQQGKEFLDRLHFGNFAGIDLRILYFVLAMFVAAMIISGNLLWIEKRIRDQATYARTTHWVGAMTLGVCAGLVFATALGFLAERAMPVHWNHRADSLIYLFVFGVIAITAAAFRTLDKQRFLNRLLIATAALLCLTVALDWLLLSNTLLHLWRQGRLATMGIELGLLLFAGCCLYTARLLFMPQHKRMAINNNTSESTAK